MGLAATLALFAVGTPDATAPARAADPQAFADYVESLWPKAAARGVSRTTFERVAATVSYHPRVVELDRDNLGAVPRPGQPIEPFAPYRARHVDAARISGGRATYARLRPLLLRAEEETGVPESVMVAIYGHETNYGRVTGSFDLPRALATLAFEGRRRTLFEDEYLATLVMVERGVPREVLKGSWAGAFGYPQFLPSVYLRLARDADGDGRASIWSSEADALASIANYLRQAGWRKGEPWGIAVSVPSGLDRNAIKSRVEPTRCTRVFARHSQWKSMREWRAAGLVPTKGAWPADSVQATLLEPDGPNNTAYLLTGNYRAILDYNCSNFYALSVGLLADEVKQ
jgi:lytic murein transglycosylase